jgi:hypothetical protein
MIARAGLAALIFTVLTFPALAGGPICAACGKEIGPGRYLQDQWKSSYHPEHSHIKRCVYCARGISEFNTHGGVHYPDGRDVCNICNETAVVEEEDARVLMNRTRDRMAGWGLTISYGAIPIALVDQATLNRLYGRSNEGNDGKINGLTTKKWTKDPAGKVVKREVNINILYGLPAEIFEKTVAHELMHAWMFLDKQPEHVPALEEGSCNLASYYILQESRTPLAGFLREAMYKSNNPVYGTGLRRAIKYVQANNFTGMVKMLRSNQDFPSGY